MRLGKALALLALGPLCGAAVTLLLSAAPAYKAWAYHYFREDYVKAAWVYDRMIDARRDTINLFMGSSHVLNAVDDGQIARRFGTGDIAYNAAIPTSARNLQYVVIRDILTRNRPRRLFLELRETEERTSHFGFPILADVREIVAAPANPWWLRDVLFMLQHRFEYLAAKAPLFSAPQTEKVSAPEFGYLPNPVQIARDILVQDAETTRRVKRWRLLPAMFGDLEFRANKLYVLEIARVCRELGIDLHFIYLPFFGAPDEPPQVEFYRGLGTVHLLPREIKGNLDYWADVTHFNPNGAAFYTQWLIDTVLAGDLASKAR